MKPRLRHRLEYALLRAVTAVLRLLPLRAARRVGEAIGRLGYAPMGIRRATVERQVAAAFPGLGAAEVARISRASYAHLGRLAIELALLPYIKKADLEGLFEPDDDFHLMARLRAGGAWH